MITEIRTIGRVLSSLFRLVYSRQKCCFSFQVNRRARSLSAHSRLDYARLDTIVEFLLNKVISQENMIIIVTNRDRATTIN